MEIEKMAGRRKKRVRAKSMAKGELEPKDERVSESGKTQNIEIEMVETQKVSKSDFRTSNRFQPDRSLNAKERKK